MKDLVSGKSEQGELLRKIPKVEEPWPLLLFIINIFFPGIGTIIAAVMCKKEEKKNFNLICGLLQFFLGCLCIGWIWSIVWGYLIFRRGTGVMKAVPDV
ncbi:hypothetical protein ABK040_015368 [Willaertia magna]